MVAAVPYFVIDSGCQAVPAEAPQKRVDASLFRSYQRNLQAQYDAASLSPQMEHWWASADNRSPRAANNRAVRQRVRSRARYEVYESGSYANGMLQAMVNAVFGCGPTLQVLTENKDFNQRVEAEWNHYQEQIKLIPKLRTMFAAKLVDGESFAERVYDDSLESPVKQNWIPSECDLWQDPMDASFDPRIDDGVVHDDFGNPVVYRRLKQHPGDDDILFNHGYETEELDSRYVIHWFTQQRPGQRRGMSEFASSLQPLARMRRYQLAVQAAADTAANHAGVMYSTASYFSENPVVLPEDEILDAVPVRNNALLTLPEGWQLQQLKAEQPHTGYVEFCEERIAAAARPFQMPLNVAMGSSRNHNFASAKLDWMQFKRANEPRRKNCQDSVLNRIVGAWLWEAARIPDYLPPYLADSLSPQIPITWQWPVDDPIDLNAQANADLKYWNMGLLTDEQYCKRNSIDIDVFYEQLSRQYQRRTEIDATVPTPGVAMNMSMLEDREPIDE